MAKSPALFHASHFFIRSTLMPSSKSLYLFLPLSNLNHPHRFAFRNSLSPLSLRRFCTSTPFPLQYELIINRPSYPSPPHQNPRTPARISSDNPPELNSSEDPSSELGFDSWVDRKLISESGTVSGKEGVVMDKAMRKYYNKRRKRMYGSDSDEDNRTQDEGFVELKPEVVEFNTLHKREEELFFHDAFAYPWEKDKHYKMLYQLEKKYFPDDGLDKAFLGPGESNVEVNEQTKGRQGVKKAVRVKPETNVEVANGMDDKGMVFFDEGKPEKENKGSVTDVTEKKVEEFFKCLKKGPAKDSKIGQAEPYLLTRHMELPARWDSPCGTVVLLNKPKGWTSFTVCGKLRRLVKVQKVGHAGTLDPMATGLLIVCVGKATKLVDRYQGMIKGYSGVFRLGEATSTWDADSPVIQREPWEHIKDDDIKKAAASFCGEIWQVPPMFSAIKVGGEKMYEKARRGESIELSPRRISIFKFDIERSLDDRQNLIFRVTCSKGTYIRSLCADLGKALGSCAHLTALRRDSIGQHLADDAWEFKELEDAITKGYF
ncbi:hypothetical protein IC582_020901 [Cucumis melo]|uniref:tRNA pseudouridine(55) synthase n=1 Tax=Cucumis melo TaxID=3656 RepID=A0A1S3C8B0_CUCME|nr:uncharacterized protein LOC103498118 [Cucumis melo]